jgi:hypothetical protein
MALTPDASWCVPAKSWDDVTRRYVRFRRVKAWRGMTHRGDGSLNPNRFTAEQAAVVGRQLSEGLEVLRKEKLLPKRPDRLREKTMSRLVARFAPDERHRPGSSTCGARYCSTVTATRVATVAERPGTPTESLAPRCDLSSTIARRAPALAR